MILKLKKIFNVNFFFSTILVPVAVLTIYCSSFAYFSSRLGLEGVNYYFAGKLEDYAVVTTVAASLFFCTLLVRGEGGKLTLKYSPEKFYLDDLFLLLLPLTPVVQYILNNRVTLSPADFFYTAVLFTLFSGFFIFAVPALFGALVPDRILVALGVAFTFTLAAMASASDQFSWFEKGVFWIQLSFFSVVFLAVWSLYKLKAKWLLYIFILANLVVNSLTQLLSQPVAAADQSAPFEGNKLLSLVEGKTPVATPNIYLLVYDAYVPNETTLGYGIDNSAQEEYLAAQGFVLYPHTYSVGAATIPTMSSVLNASTDYYGNERRAVSGDGVTQNILRDIGYKTFGVFWADYFFSGYGVNYDYSFPENSTPPYVKLLKAIFLGEFRFDIEDVGYRDMTRDQFLETKRDFFEEVSSTQGFIYMHTDVPAHSQNSGACLPNETELFEERLEAANIEMKQDVDLILERDPDAIVIIAGDHGPYLTKNCYETTNDISEITRLDIQDRHGTFLAVRWPAEGFEEYDDIVVLQDLFPAVFSYIYKDEMILNAKIDPIITAPYATSGASVDNGIIVGGVNDGEFLYLFGR
ncbi:MAG: hypothetical protein IH588_05890 [Anaerolineales bacterium]|nr:hypothetical protein [Anaerolineales bacterium]